MEDVLTAQQAAEVLGYHIQHMRQLLREGRVKAHKFNTSWMIERAEVERVKALQGPGGRLPKAPKQE